MTRSRNGFSSFTKGLFVGSLLVAAVTLLYAPRSGTGRRSDITQEDVRSQRRYRPLSTARVEKIFETGKRVNPSIGWRVMFYCASAVAMIANLRMKKI